MAIAYQPGWFEMLQQAGLGNAMNNISNAVAPDAMAAQRLRELTMQNPMLMEQIANMDDGTRQGLANTLGFKNKNPLAQLPIGNERRQREELQSAIKSLDATGKSERAAALTGTRTAQQRAAQEQDLALGTQQQQLNALNTEILSGRVKDMKRMDTMLLDAQSKVPELDKVDINAVVSDFLRKGKPIDSSLAMVIQNNPGARELFDLASKRTLQQMQDEARQRLASMKDPNESMLYLRALTEYGNQINDAQMRVQAELKNASDMGAQMMNPSLRASVGPLQEQLNALRENAQMNAELTQSYMEQIAKSKGIPVPAKRPGPVASPRPPLADLMQQFIRR